MLALLEAQRDVAARTIQRRLSSDESSLKLAASPRPERGDAHLEMRDAHLERGDAHSEPGDASGAAHDVIGGTGGDLVVIGVFVHTLWRDVTARNMCRCCWCGVAFSSLSHLRTECAYL